MVKLVRSWDSQFAQDDHSEGQHGGSAERQGDPEYEADGGSDDEDDDMSMTEESYDEQFAQLEEESRMLVSDVHELAQFTKLNFTGFIKIVKVGVKVLLEIRDWTLTTTYLVDIEQKHDVSITTPATTCDLGSKYPSSLSLPTESHRVQRQSRVLRRILGQTSVLQGIYINRRFCMPKSLLKQIPISRPDSTTTMV